MSVIKSRLIGVVMVLIAVMIGVYYSLCVFINGADAGLFRSGRIFGIPILNEYWTIALPIYVGIMVLLLLIAWLGVAAIFTRELPLEIEQEKMKIQKLDDAIRDQARN